MTNLHKYDLTTIIECFTVYPVLKHCIDLTVAILSTFHKDHTHTHMGGQETLYPEAVMLIYNPQILFPQPLTSHVAHKMHILQSNDG